MADELNGQALPVHHTNPYKIYNFQNDDTSWYFWSVILTIGALTKLGLFFPVVFELTLAEQLYCDKGLLCCCKDLFFWGEGEGGMVRQS